MVKIVIDIARISSIIAIDQIHSAYTLELQWNWFRFAQ